MPSKRENLQSLRWLPILLIIAMFGLSARLVLNNSKEATIRSSPNGKFLVAFSGNKAPLFWEIPAGNPLNPFADNTSARVVGFSRNNKFLATGTAVGFIELWEIADKKLLATWKGSDQPVAIIDDQPNNTLLIAGFNEGIVKAWDIASSQLLQPIPGALTRTNTGGLFAAESDTGVIQLWEVTSKKLLVAEKGPKQPVTTICFSPDHDFFVSGFADGTIKIWEIPTGKLLQSLPGHLKAIQELSFSQDGKTFFSRSIDQRTLRWKIGDQETRDYTIQINRNDEETQYIEYLAIAADGQRAVSTSSQRELRIWDLKTGQCLQTIPYIFSRAITPDLRRAVTIYGSDDLEVWDLVAGRNIYSLSDCHEAQIETYAVSANGKRVVSISRDKVLKVWDLETGKCLKTISDVFYEAILVISPDGKKVIYSTRFARDFKILDLETGSISASLEGHNDEIRALVISTDGKRIFSASQDETLKVWDLETRRCLQTIKDAGRVLAMKGCANGKLVVCSTSQQELKIWDLERGLCLQTLPGLEHMVDKIDVSADGRWVIYTEGLSNQFKLWDTGKIIFDTEIQ